MTEILHSPTSLSGADRPRRAALQGAVLLAVIFPLALGLAYALANVAGAARPGLSVALTSALYAVGALAVLVALMANGRYPHPRLGLCNAITLTRAAGISVMAGLVIAPVTGLGWGLVALAGGLLVLDGLDGWAARRARMQSAFGARLDVESDVAFAITLAALAVALGQVGPWFLLLGLMRPLFLGAGRIWPALRAPLPDAPWRKRMAALQMTVQVVLIAPVIAPPLSVWIGAALLGAVLVSFAVDIRWLLRQKPQL